LTLTGLVLAGANGRGAKKGAPVGLLTAEAIAGRNLERLQLAVLSACDSGLGEAQSGEGVFGLQRAFHLGGRLTRRELLGNSVRRTVRQPALERLPRAAVRQRLLQLGNAGVGGSRAGTDQTPSGSLHKAPAAASASKCWARRTAKRSDAIRPSITTHFACMVDRLAVSAASDRGS
jgi:hypothetical protein